jgi:predicted DNA binding CopG/RHH family protein
MKRTNDEIEKLAEDLLNDGDQEKWERGELGRDPEHAKLLPEDMTREIHASKRKSYPTSIRLTKMLIEELSALALENGMPYQTYLRMVLMQHVKKTREEKSKSQSEAS